MRITASNILCLAISLITISSISSWTNLPLQNTFIWWIVDLLVLWSFVRLRKQFPINASNNQILFIKLYLFYNIICIARGAVVAENYWEWKNLISTAFILLLPLSIFISTNEFLILKILRNWFKFVFPFFLMFLPFMAGDAFGHYLVPITFVLLFFPILDIKWKVISILCLIVVWSDLSARSNVIKFTIPLLFSLLYYFRLFIPKRVLSLIRILLCFAPFVLFSLGLSGLFNIFKMQEYITDGYSTSIVSNGEVIEYNLTGDTRTYLYTEVLTSAVKNQYIWLGRTPARGADSTAWGEKTATDKLERFAYEASILNIFTWTGLVGVILYFFIFFSASYLAVNKSNNFFMRIVGLYVAFRWCFAWVEDFSRFDLSYLFLWFIIGMCFSKSFRRMTNLEMIFYVRGIFNIKYLKLIYSFDFSQVRILEKSKYLS